MDYRKQVDLILKQYGAELIRSRKHLVFRFPDGRQFVMASTPSDVNAPANQYRDLCRILNISRVYVHNPERKRKPGAPVAAVRFEYFSLPEKSVEDLVAMYPKLPSLNPPKSCNTAMWRESLPCTPLFAILKRFVRLVDFIR